MADEWESEQAGVDSGSKREFDWIDDAFDDKKTAADMEAAKGPKAAGCLLVAVLVAAVALVFFALFGITGALSA